MSEELRMIEEGEDEDGKEDKMRDLNEAIRVLKEE